MALTYERIGASDYLQPMGMLAYYRVLDTESRVTPFVLDPPFQRGAVWSVEQKQAWIESILMGLGLPSIFINQFPAEHPRYGWSEVVIDGKQRLLATAGFMCDEFRVRGELWSEQDKTFQRTFKMSLGIVPVVVTRFETERECVELYLKLLRAGTAHSTEDIEKAVDYLEGLR